MDDFKNVERLASDLEGICANLSGSFYHHREGRHGESRRHELSMIHGIAWSIRYDLDVLRSSKVNDGTKPMAFNGRLKSITDSIRLPRFVWRDSGGIPFFSDENYYGGQFADALHLDPISTYELFLNALPESILETTKNSTMVPRQVTNPALAYALHMVLDENEPYFDERTGFRARSKIEGWPLNGITMKRAERFLSDLKKFVDFPFNELLSCYVKAIEDATCSKSTREIPASVIFWPDSVNGEDNDDDEGEDKASVDVEQKRRNDAQVADIVAHIKKGEWQNGELLEKIAKYHFMSDPVNYYTFFEAARDNYGNIRLVQSKRREEPVYVDYTGNLGRVEKWMDFIVQGKPVTNLALSGKAGTGKTAALITAAKNHSIKVIDVTMDVVASNSLTSIVRALHSMRNYPCVIYLDNVDMPKENDQRNSRVYDFINNLERSIEGAFAIRPNIKFAMSTSTYGRLPDALKRRFSLKYEFGVPNMTQQSAIVDAHMKAMGMDGSADDVLREIYHTERLSYVKKSMYLTPALIRDHVVNRMLE